MHTDTVKTTQWIKVSTLKWRNVESSNAFHWGDIYEQNAIVRAHACMHACTTELVHCLFARLKVVAFKHLSYAFSFRSVFGFRIEKLCNWFSFSNISVFSHLHGCSHKQLTFSFKRLKMCAKIEHSFPNFTKMGVDISTFGTHRFESNLIKLKPKIPQSYAFSINWFIEVFSV